MSVHFCVVSKTFNAASKSNKAAQQSTYQPRIISSASMPCWPHLNPSTQARHMSAQPQACFQWCFMLQSRRLKGSICKCKGIQAVTLSTFFHTKQTLRYSNNRQARIHELQAISLDVGVWADHMAGPKHHRAKNSDQQLTGSRKHVNTLITCRQLLLDVGAWADNMATPQQALSPAGAEHGVDPQQ